MSLLIASSKLEVWWWVSSLHCFSQMLGHNCEIYWNSVGEFDWMKTKFLVTFRGPGHFLWLYLFSRFFFVPWVLSVNTSTLPFAKQTWGSVSSSNNIFFMVVTLPLEAVPPAKGCAALLPENGNFTNLCSKEKSPINIKRLIK